jgi:hypothetical protein
MRLAPKPARTTERCKIKPVYPAVRSVSTPRRTKDLPARGPVDRGLAFDAVERLRPMRSEAA